MASERVELALVLEAGFGGWECGVDWWGVGCGSGLRGAGVNLGARDRLGCGGGLGMGWIFIKEHLNRYVSTEQSNQYVVWITLNYRPITHVGFVYFPLIGTTVAYWSDTCPFDDLQAENLSRRSTGLVSISGDFNARTAQIHDTNQDNGLKKNTKKKQKKTKHVGFSRIMTWP